MQRPNQRISQKSIRIFHLEDSHEDRDAVRAMCRATKDLVYAGEAEKDSRDLVDSIRRSGARIAIIDPDLNALGVAEAVSPSGLTAIRRIRVHLGRRVKILVFTGRKDVRPKALEAGADQVLLKGGSRDALRNAIRALAGTGRLDKSQKILGKSAGDFEVGSAEAYCQRPREEP